MKNSKDGAATPTETGLTTGTHFTQADVPNLITTLEQAIAGLDTDLIDKANKTKGVWNNGFNIFEQGELTQEQYLCTLGRIDSSLHEQKESYDKVGSRHDFLKLPDFEINGGSFEDWAADLKKALYKAQYDRQHKFLTEKLERVKTHLSKEAKVAAELASIMEEAKDFIIQK